MKIRKWKNYGDMNSKNLLIIYRLGIINIIKSLNLEIIIKQSQNCQINNNPPKMHIIWTLAAPVAVVNKADMKKNIKMRMTEHSLNERDKLIKK